MKRQWLLIGTLVAVLALVLATGCHNPGAGSTIPGVASTQVLAGSGSETDDAIVNFWYWVVFVDDSAARFEQVVFADIMMYQLENVKSYQGPYPSGYSE